MEEVVKTEPKVTEPVVETTKSEDLIPQDQVNGIVAKEIKKAQEKLLKDLGVEDVKSAKDGIAKAKEIMEAQKTDAEKLAERLAEREARVQELEEKEKLRETESLVNEILKELEVDTKHIKTVLKLTELEGLELTKDSIKPVIEQTINEELPMLVKGETVKVGAEPVVSDKLPQGTNDYLADKYKNNPYYKK